MLTQKMTKTSSLVHYVQIKLFVQFFWRFAKLYIFGKFRTY